MAELVALDANTHAGLTVTEAAALRFFSSQHVMNLRATEIGMAAGDFPLFFSRNAQSGHWALSAVTSLEPGRNLLIRDGHWQATYRPTGLQTYPLFLMQAKDSEKGYVVGMDGRYADEGPADGERLFEDDGKPSMLLNRLTKLLEDDIENDVQTRLFVQALEGLSLLKAIDVHVFFDDGTTQTITGLNTLDEDRIKSLTAAELEDLNGNGYLLLIHAMLISIFQLNTLVRRHNEAGGAAVVKQVKLEVARDFVGAQFAS